MKSGALDQRVTLERYEPLEDEIGQPVPHWVPTETVWAAVEPLMGREYLAAQAVQSELVARVRIRHRPGITTADRVTHEGTSYGITSVQDVRSEGRELVLMVKALG